MYFELIQFLLNTYSIPIKHLTYTYILFKVSHVNLERSNFVIENKHNLKEEFHPSFLFHLSVKTIPLYSLSYTTKI